jgi:protein SCO1/2
MHAVSKTLSPGKKIGLFLGIVLAGIGTAIWFAGPPPSEQTQAISDILASPRPLPAFTLSRGEQKSLTREDLRGKWSLLFFGYTHCPDVCPTTLAELARARQLLATDSDVLAETQFIFVSVDPERDSPDLLRDYVQYFAADFIGATGSPQQLAAITRVLDIKHSRGEAGADGYVVNHSSAVLLIDPQVRYYARLKAPHYGEEVRQRYLAIRDHYREKQRDNQRENQHQP